METLSLPWLEPGTPLPPPESALGADSPWPGLLAGSESLNADMLLAAYAQGIFPWSGPEDPVLWWSTDPRMVLMPAHFRLHVSLRKTLRTFAQRHDANICIGGLYVVALGHAIFGESMFSRQTDASKIALAALVCLCLAHDVELIDCQQQTAHLASLGAHPVARANFLTSIQRGQQRPAMRWQFEPALWNELLPSQAR